MPEQNKLHEINQIAAEIYIKKFKAQEKCAHPLSGGVKCTSCNHCGKLKGEAE
jgi:hypothetical protein